MENKKILFIIFILFMVRIVFFIFDDYAFSEEASIRNVIRNKKDPIELLLKKDTHFGVVGLYKNLSSGDIGVVSIEKRLGILWRVNGYGEMRLNNDLPFITIGKHKSNKEEIEQHVIGFYSQDKAISYLVFGPEDDAIEEKFKAADLDLNSFKQMNPDYLVGEVINGYVLLVDDEYSVNRWNFYAFNSGGNLIASKIAGSGDPVYRDD